jgi:hypothetical protein
VVLFPAGVRNLLFSVTSRPALGPTQPPMEWVSRALPRWVKRPGHETEDLPRSIEVNNGGAIFRFPHTSQCFTFNLEISGQVVLQLLHNCFCLYISNSLLTGRPKIRCSIA